MIDDSTSLASDIEVSSAREWSSDEYMSCLTILVYRPLRYDTESTITTCEVTSEIYERLLYRLFGWYDTILCDWEDTEEILTSSESLGIEIETRPYNNPILHYSISAMYYWSLFTSESGYPLTRIDSMDELISVLVCEALIPFSTLWSYLGSDSLTRLYHPRCYSRLERVIHIIHLVLLSECDEECRWRRHCLTRERIRYGHLSGIDIVI